MHKNYKIVLSDDAFNSLEKFIKSLDSKYTKLYSDSGLGGVERLIINRYIDNTTELKEKLLTIINDKIQEGPLGRYIIDKTNKIEIIKFIVFINSYNIVVHATKDTKNYIAIIDNLKISI